MSALICGSLAYDTIMVFPGRFRDHILPDRIHMLNVSFLTPTMRRNFGGCAGNIAYNLKLLETPGDPMGTVGHDFGPYRQWLERCGIGQSRLRLVEEEFTAQAYITTDQDDNQITAFHPGAMNHSHVQPVPRGPAGAHVKSDRYEIGMISPDGREGMLRHAAQFVAEGIPFLFDPGQGLPMFNGEELLAFVDQATWVTVNDYEGQMLSERTGLAPEALAKRVKALIVTRGAEGSYIYTDGKRLEIPAARPLAVKDPTGCGDAYRAGLVHGLLAGMDWELCGRVASLMGALKIESHGPQNHSLARGEFADRFKASFGMTL